MMEIRTVLTSAIETGLTITVIYHGGSQPGSARELQILSLSDDDVTAVDLATHTTRTFKLDKVELSSGTPAPRYDPSRAKHPHDTAPIAATFAPLVSDLQAMGWMVDLSENHVGVYVMGTTKRGKPKKVDGVSLTFCEWVDDTIDFDTGENLRRRSARPYGVYGRGLTSPRTFKHKEPAAELFMQEAMKLAPTLNSPEGKA